MWRCFRGIGTIETWVVCDFNLTLEGVESRSQVKSDRTWMIKRAGVHPKTADRFLPRLLNGVIHQKTACTPADESGRNPEKRELACFIGPEIKFKQSFVSVVSRERVDLDQGMANDCLECIRPEREARKPKPILTDPSIKITVPICGRMMHPPDAHVGHIAAASTHSWRSKHPEVGDNRSNFSGWNVGKAVVEHLRVLSNLSGNVCGGS